MMDLDTRKPYFDTSEQQRHKSACTSAQSNDCFCYSPSGKYMCCKTFVKRPLKNRQNKDLNDLWKVNEGQKYCRMLPLEHSAILLPCIKR